MVLLGSIEEAGDAPAIRLPSIVARSRRLRYKPGARNPSARRMAGTHLAPILDRMGIDRSNWVDTVRDFGRMFKEAAGRTSLPLGAGCTTVARGAGAQGKAAA